MPTTLRPKLKRRTAWMAENLFLPGVIGVFRLF
jgi:hypothetical protein